MFDFFAEFKRKTLEAFKYASAACMMAATLMMFSPQYASASVWPWALYLFANTVWLYDSWKQKNKPWIAIALGFVILDVGLVFTRL